MEFDISPANTRLLEEILREYGPTNMSDEQELFLTSLADYIKDCSEAGTTLHINF